MSSARPEEGSDVLSGAGRVGDGSSLVGSPFLKKFPEDLHGFKPLHCGTDPISFPLLLPYQVVSSPGGFIGR